MRNILLNHVYRHFKGKYYLTMNIAEHTGNGELYVVYRALYGEGRVYIRPMEEFLSKTDKKKYPNALQDFRFELSEIPSGTMMETDQ